MAFDERVAVVAESLAAEAGVGVVRVGQEEGAHGSTVGDAMEPAQISAESIAAAMDAIVRSGNYNVVIGETDRDVQDKLAWIRAHNLTAVSR